MPHDAFYLSKPWKEARGKYLRIHPWCQVCVLIGVRTRAVEVDHIVTIARGGEPLNPANFASRCKTHHSQKTRVLDTPGQPGRDKLVTTGPDGFPALIEYSSHGDKTRT